MGLGLLKLTLLSLTHAHHPLAEAPRVQAARKLEHRLLEEAIGGSGGSDRWRWRPVAATAATGGGDWRRRLNERRRQRQERTRQIGTQMTSTRRCKKISTRCMCLDLKYRLPFKVGQVAESKSFTVGFRSAWFRCKIQDIGFTKGHLGCLLEYFDFPDEKRTWTRLYQMPQYKLAQSCADSNMELMVRPSFPPCYQESQLPDPHPRTDVIAIIKDAWKVGDMVDWWYDSCYWSGRITQLLGDDKVQIELPRPPTGEGGSYCAHCKDLRPYLDWSPENGWTVPTSGESDISSYNARIICAHSPEVERINTNMDLKYADSKGGKSLCLHEGSAMVDEAEDKSEPDSLLKLSVELEIEHSPDISMQNFESNNKSRTNLFTSYDPPEKGWIINPVTSVSYPETVESSIIELEELTNKLKWLKDVLQFGFRWSNSMKPSWKFLENHGS